MVDTFNRSLVSKPKLSNSPYSKPEFINKNPVAQAVMSKLVSSQIPQRTNNRGNREINTPSEQLIRRISDQTAGNISDSEAMLQLLPETKMAMNILVSSIISPNDMIGNDLHFSVHNCSLPSEMSVAMLQVIQNYFEKVYKIERQLKPILEDILFKKGAYPLIVVPESSIDHLINGSTVTTESYNSGIKSAISSVGILGKNKRSINISTESTKIDINHSKSETIVKIDDKEILTITDNPSALKIGTLNKKMSASRADMLASGGRRINYSEIESAYYKRRQYNYNATQVLKTTDQLDRPTVGHPMVIKAPVESMIPVHVPGDPTDHVGYFLLLDRTGNPINNSEYINFFNELSMNVSSNREQISQLLNQTRLQTQGVSNNTFTYQDKESSIHAYQEMIEGDLLERLKNGIYGDDVAISGSTEIYRIMMSRSLAKQQTQLLYVPRSLVVYMAFDYNPWGVGKSLLEDTKILGSIRAMLLFANTMAEIKNSVGHENVAIELDPEDPDPSSTVEFLFHEYAKNRQSRYPVGATNPLDLVTYLQNAGVQLTVSGHEGYPVTKLDVNSVQTNKTTVDNELNERLKKQHLLAWGIPPETIDAAGGADFAATVVRNNLLFTKTVVDYQNLFTEFLGDFIRKYTLNSSILMDELLAVVIEQSPNLSQAIRSRFKSPDDYIVDFLGSFIVDLPTPDTAKLTTQLDAFNVYSEMLEKALESYFNSSFYNETMLGEKLGGAIETTKEAVKAFYLRRWLNENNVLPELNDLVTWSEEDGPALDLLNNYDNLLEGLSQSLRGFMLKVTERNAKNDTAVPEITESDYTDSNSDNDGSSDDLDTGLDDDFDIDAEGEGEETPPEGEEVEDESVKEDSESETKDDSENSEDKEV